MVDTLVVKCYICFSLRQNYPICKASVKDKNGALTFAQYRIKLNPYS